MVSFGGGEISIAPGDLMTIWDLARFAKNGLSAVKSTGWIRWVAATPSSRSSSIEGW
jgi:hypothetical protein